MTENVTIVQTGTANIASVCVALERLGATYTLSSDPAEIEAAGILIVPGVGSFGNVMTRVESSGIAGVLRNRIAAGRPLLAICLGMQIFFEGSEESPGIPGIGALKGQFKKFPPAVMSPLLGWSEVSVAAVGQLLSEKGFAYFAHSFYLPQAPEGWYPASSTHGSSYVSAIEKGPILLCQFHAELSGEWGSRLLARWYKNAKEALV